MKIPFFMILFFSYSFSYAMNTADQAVLEVCTGSSTIQDAQITSSTQTQITVTMSDGNTQIFSNIATCISTLSNAAVIAASNPSSNNATPVSSNLWLTPITSNASMPASILGLAQAGNCDQACAAEDQALNNEIKNLTALCGAATPPATDSTPVTATFQDGTTINYSNVGACIADFTSKYGIIDPYCKAYNAAKASTTMLITATTLYSAAAAVCGLAAWLAANPVTTAASTAIQAACSVIGLAATGTDIAGIIEIQDITDHTNQFWINQWNGAYGLMTGAAGASGLLATGTAGVVAYNSIVKPEPPESSEAELKQRITLIPSSDAEATKEIAKDLAKSESDQATKQALTKTSLTLGVVAVAYAGIAIAEGLNIKFSQDSVAQSCAAIQSLQYNSNTPTTVGGGSSGSSASGGGTGSTGGGGTGTTATNSNNTGSPPPTLSDYFNAAAATAGGTTPLQAINPQALNNALNSLGTSLGDMHNKIAQGQSPAQVASDLLSNGLGDQASGAFKNLEDQIKNGDVSIPGITPNSAMQTGGGTSHSSSASSDSGFDLLAAFKKSGPDDKTSPFAPQSITFNPSTTTDPKASSNDIWHSKTHDSLFQIVAKKIHDSILHDAVDHLEWTTPMNRAIMGLKKSH